MVLTITFFSCRLFLYCSYNMWRLMHCRNIVSEFWLFVDFFRYTKHLHLVSPLVPKSVTSYNIWPLASYLLRWFLRSQPFFYARRILHNTSCYGFLSVLPSVRPSVSRKVFPSRRAVSLRQLSFLFYLAVLCSHPFGYLCVVLLRHPGCWQQNSPLSLS